MKPFQIFFRVDGYPNECLVIEKSEEKAKEFIEQSYWGAESIEIFPIENRMIVEMGGNF